MFLGDNSMSTYGKGPAVAVMCKLLSSSCVMAKIQIDVTGHL